LTVFILLVGEGSKAVVLNICPGEVQDVSLTFSITMKIGLVFDLGVPLNTKITYKECGMSVNNYKQEIS
jgi:hypothetical protein